MAAFDLINLDDIQALEIDILNYQTALRRIIDTINAGRLDFNDHQTREEILTQTLDHIYDIATGV